MDRICQINDHQIKVTQWKTRVDQLVRESDAAILELVVRTHPDPPMKSKVSCEVFDL